MFIKQLILAVPLVMLATFAPLASAEEHSWDMYHWGRTSNPFTIQLGDNVSSNWDKYLKSTASLWSVSPVLDATVVSGKTKSRTCAPTAGRVEVCNDKYGSNGWLGLAQIWVNGEHIVMATVKMNDTYFSTKAFNTNEWKNLVMCQEIGHIFGLDHQDEDFTNENLGTCMDYTNDPSTNQRPNQADYDALLAKYEHIDSVNTMITKNQKQTAGRGSAVANGAEVSEGTTYEDARSWGKEVRRDSKRHGSLHRRSLGKETELYTFVTWAE